MAVSQLRGLLPCTCTPPKSPGPSRSQEEALICLCPRLLELGPQDVMCFVMASPQDNVPVSPHSPDTTRALSLSLVPLPQCAFPGMVGSTRRPPRWFEGWVSSWFCWHRAPGNPIPTAPSPGAEAGLARGHSSVCRGLRPAGSSQQWEAIRAHPELREPNPLTSCATWCHRDAPPAETTSSPEPPNGRKMAQKVFWRSPELNSPCLWLGFILSHLHPTCTSQCSSPYWDAPSGGKPPPFHCPTQDIQGDGTSILTETRLKTSRAAPKGVTKGSPQPLISAGRRRHRPSDNGRADKRTHPAPEPLPAGKCYWSQRGASRWKARSRSQPAALGTAHRLSLARPPTAATPTGLSSLSQPGKPLAWHSFMPGFAPSSFQISSLPSTHRDLV